MSETILQLLDENYTEDTDDVEYLAKVIRNYSRILASGATIEVPRRVLQNVINNECLTVPLAKNLMLECHDDERRAWTINNILIANKSEEIIDAAWGLLPKSEWHNVIDRLLFNTDSVSDKIKIDYIKHVIENKDKEEFNPAFVAFMAAKSDCPIEALKAIYENKYDLPLSNHTIKLIEERLNDNED